jgi:membrane protease YdiL (CAAX protease family)
VGATAAETLAATVLALALSLRSGSSLVWLFLPLAILICFRRSLSEHALDLRLRPPSFAIHLLLGGSLLLLYALIHTAFALATGHHPQPPRLSWHLAQELIEELLVVGVPEEVFFRGYLQTRWNRVLGTPWRLAGARVGPALLLQGVVFAICHLATGDWTRLRVFFFAVLAGWLRERSGSILGPAVYHAVANLWFRLLLSTFR